MNGGEQLAIDWAAARATPTPAANVVTVVTQGGKCTLVGPAQVPAGTVSVKLINQDSVKSAALVIVTLDEGKTLADCEAWKSLDQPPWTQLLGFIEIGPEEESVQNIVASSKPLYFACYDADPQRIIGALGPVEIKK